MPTVKVENINGEISENMRTVETIQVAEIKDCQFCSEPLEDIPSIGYERRTRKVVSHIDQDLSQMQDGKQGTFSGRYGRSYAVWSRD